MSNTAKITVTAIDKASATMLKIRAEMRRMTQPMRDIKASMGRFTEASGLRQMQRDFQKIAQTTRSVAGGVTRIVAPMAAVVGVGSIAGLAELSKQWANMGWSIDRTAQTIGVAPAKLQALQGAAKLAGLSAQDMTSSLHALGNAIYGAKWSGDNKTAATMNALGLKFRFLKNGSVDTTASLMDLSKAIQHYSGNAELQEKIAKTFGVDSLLPLLRQGPEAIRAYEAEARRRGYVQTDAQRARAKRLAHSYAELSLSLTGVRNTIADALSPVITPLITQIGNWVTANRVLIGQQVSQWISEIVQWVRSVNWGAVWQSIKQTVAEIRNIAVGINSAVQSVGGWKNAIEIAFGGWAIGKIGLVTLAVLRVAGAFGAVRTAAAAASVAQGATAAAGGAAMIGAGGAALLAGTGAAAGYGLWYAWNRYKHDNAAAAERQASHAKDLASHGYGGRLKSGLAMLQSMGMSRRDAAGLMANFTAESGLNPHAVGDKGAAYGIGQWHADRQAQFKKLFGIPMQKSTLQQQLGFARWELGNTEKGAQAKAAKAATAQEAGAIYSRDYERPAHADREAATRGILAQQIYAQNQMMFRGAPQATPAQRVDVHVTMGNVPPGSKVTASDGHGNAVPVRVGRNLVGAF